MLFQQPDILMMEDHELIMPVVAEMAQSNSEGEDIHGRMRTGGDADEVENQEYDVDGGSGEDEQDGTSSSQAGKGKRKRYHRHTQQQIQLMEAYVILVYVFTHNNPTYIIINMTILNSFFLFSLICTNIIT